MNQPTQLSRTGARCSRRPQRLVRLIARGAIVWLEPLEERTLLSTITWNSTAYPTGGNWDTGTNWIGNVAPGPNDIAVIKNLTAGSTVYLDTGYADSVAGLTMDSTVNLEVDNGSLSLGVGSTASIGSLTVESNAAFNVGPAANVTILSGETLTDDGALSFSSGDVVTLQSVYPTYGAYISISGSMSSNSATFTSNGNSNITFSSTGTISGTNNTYNGPLYVPYTDVASLAGNTSISEVEIEAGTISSGTLTLDPIGNSSSFVFPDGFTVADGGTLDVGANVSVAIASGETLSDAGTMSFSSGDAVTLQSAYPTYGAYITVSGSMSSSGATFTSDGNSTITFSSTGTISGTGNTYVGPLYVPYTDVASLAGNTSISEVEITAGTISSGTLTLSPIGSSSSYVFPSGFTVANGGTLDVGANVSVAIASGETLSDAGTMSFSSGDAVTLQSAYPTYGAFITVSGSLSSSGATFTSDGNSTITFSSTGTISGTNNTYDGPLYVPYTDVASLAGNTSISEVEITAGTISSGTLTLDPIGSSSSFVFPSGFTVANGGTLDVGANVSVAIPSGETLSDAGTMSFSSGDAVTLQSAYPTYGAFITVSGSLSSSGATFAIDGNSNITFSSTGTISGTNNTYAGPLYVPYTDVASLAGNTSISEVEITAGTISSGTLTLNPIGSSSSYVFPSGFTVADGGTLDVSANVSVAIAGGATLSDAGTLSFSSGDAVTLQSAYGVGGSSITVSGSMSSSGATFTSNGTSSITFSSTGTISGTNNTYDAPLYLPYTDVASLAGNTSFEQVEITSGTISSGTLTLNPIGNSTTLTYVFADDFTVANGATLAVSPDVAMEVASGETLTVAGAISFSSGDVITLDSAYPTYGAYIAVSGSMSSSGATFNGYDKGNLSFSSTGVISGANNSYNLPIYVPYTDVPALAGNTSLNQVEIIAGTLSSGTLTLNPIGNSSNFTFVFPSGFTVANGATLTVSANVPVAVSSSQTLNDAGTLSFASGDVVTVSGSAQIAVTGTLNAIATTFTGSNITVNSGGTLIADDETIFSLSSLTLNSGATATLTTDVLSGVFTINSNTTLNVTGNDFSNLNATKGLVAAGDPSAVINVSGNYWGTTVAGIDAIIYDHNDNSNLPTVNFQPYVSYSSGTEANSATVTYSTSAQTFNLTASVTTTAGFVISEGTETFSIFNGTTQIGQTTAAVQVENGSATGSYTLPAGTPQGLYTIEAYYSGSDNYLPSTDISHFLTVGPGATTTTVSNESATFSDVSDQSIPLSAQVSSTAGTVNEGAVTFTVYSGSNPVGSPVVVDVSGDEAVGTYDLLEGTAGGDYTIQAAYTDSLNFTDSTADSSFIVSGAATTTTMADASTAYSASTSEPVALSAAVTSAAGTVDQGSVTFTILNSSNTPIVSDIYAPVSNGVASTTAYLPAGTAVGQVYTIEAVYGGSTSFAASTTPTYSSLVVDAAPTITTATNASASFNSSTQTITLSADVTSNGFAVSEGTLTFTVLNGTTPEGPAVTVDMTGGIVSTPYTLDAGVPIGTYIIEAVYDDSTSGDYLGSSDLSHTLTITQPPAYQLVIAPGSPSTVTAGQVFAPLVVDEEDANGNIEAGDNTTIVTVTFGGATFTAQVVAGVATFTNVVDDVAGTASLTATSGNLVPAILNGIVVTPAAASQLVVIQQPSASAVANQPFMTQPIVAEEDQYGNILTGDSTSTITAARGSLGTDTLEGANLTIPLTNGVADFSGLYYDRAELMNISFSTDAPNVSSVTSTTVSVSPSQATQLVVQPGYSTTATAGDPLSNPLVVYEEDKFGNIETGDDSSIVTAIQTTGKGPLASIDAIVSGGIARFTGLADTRAETTSLQFVSGTIYSTTTSSIVVSPGAASALVIVTQPGSTATAGAPFPIQPEVEVVDAFGNLETSDNSTQITVTSSGNGTLLGSTSVTVSGGIAQFSGLEDNTAETFALTFTGSGLTPVTSSSVTVSAGAAVSLEVSKVTRPPKGVVAGIAFGATIDAMDNYGNIATSFDGQVTAALAAGSDGTLSGTTVMAAVNGEADFDNLFSNVSGSIALTASGTSSSGTSLSAPATDPIPVVPGAPTQLVIAQAPAAGSRNTAGVAFALQPIVYEEDAFNNLVTTATPVAITVTSTGTGTLRGGSTQATTENGVATFSGLLDDMAETIALDFTSPGLTTAVSSTFIISPAALDHIAIQAPLVTTQATAGVAFGTQPVIGEYDQFGNLETDDSTTQIVATLATGAGPLQGTTEVTVQGGVATFTNLADDVVGTITLDFAIPNTSFAAGPSSNIVISPGPAFQLKITTQPGSSATAGVPLGAIVIDEEDANGNLETGDNATVITAAPSSGTATLQSAQATVQGGVATFIGLTDDTAGSIQLIFSGGGVTSSPSNAITVAPASANHLVIESQPPTGPSTVTAGQPFSAVVWEEDKFNNRVTTDNGTQVTAALASGAGPISGTLVTTMSAGAATFNDLVDETAGLITLNFSGGGLTVGPSNTVEIVAAAASQLMIETPPPTSVTAGQSFGAIIWEEDAYHNHVTTDSTTEVTASLHSGSGTLIGAGTPVTMVNGVATFTGLADDTAGTITLEFSDGGLTGVPSGNVVITPGAIAKLALEQAPSTTIPSTAGQAFATQPIVAVEDQYGNLETSDNTTAISPSLTGATDVLQNGSPITVTGGIAKFANLADDLAETVALRFTGGGLAAVTSGNFVVNPGAPARLVIATEPSSSALAGAAFATQPVIVEEDQFGNVERSDNSTPITVSLNTGTGPLQGTTTVSVTGGVASFSNLADTIAETITLRFTSGSQAAAVSTPIAVAGTVTPPPGGGSSAQAPAVSGVKLSYSTPKKGKKSVTGFEIDFNIAMNQNSLLNRANYSMIATTKKGKKVTKTIVTFTPSSPSSTAVVLTFPAKQKFAQGGAITFNGGITSAAGVSLMPGYSFTIEANAKGIVQASS